MPTNTTTYSLQKPTVGGDEDAWGGYINANLDKVDDLLDGTTPVTGIDINSGAIDGTPIGANSASTGAFTTVVGTTLNLSTGLAANLSTNGFDLVTTSNADLDLAPNGTGKVVVRGNTNSGKIVLNCENNSHGVTLASPPHSASATYEVALPNALGTTNASAVVTTDANGDTTFGGDVTLPDKIVHSGDTNTAIRFPADDTVSFETGGSERFRFASSGQLGIGGATYGTSGQVLTSGGASAAPTWADAGGGGAYELIQKQTISSNVTSISFNSITAPQEQLLLLFNQVTIDATNHIRFNYKDSGYNHLTGTSAYSSASLYHDASGAGVQGGSSSYNFATLTPGLHVKDGTAFSASYYFSGWGTSTPFFEGVATYKNSSANNSFARSAQAVGYYGSGTPTRIYIYTSANYFTGGEIYLYKLV